MPALKARPLIAWVGAVALGALADPGLPAPAPKPLPLDLAFSRRQVETLGRPVLSPDGRHLAYEIRTPPERKPGVEEKRQGRFLASGLPTSAVGLRLHVLDLETRQSKPVCGEGVTCWRPSWSPGGRRLAYFSDQGGAVHLWLYDLPTGRARRLGEARIRAKLWPGDEAAFSPDGRELYVPIAPAAGPAQPPRKAASPAEAGGPTVRVYATGGGESEPEAAGVEAMNAHFLAENRAALAALDAETGAVRVVVPAAAEPPPSCLRLSPDGRWLSYLSVFLAKSSTAMQSFHDLVVVPAKGGRPQVVAKDLELPEGDYYGATYRWTPDSKRLVFLRGRRLWLAEMGPSPAGAPRPLAHDLGDLLEEPLLLTADGKAAVVALAADGPQTLYFAAPKALAWVPLDGSAPRRFDLAAIPVPADQGTLWQPDPQAFYAVRAEPEVARRSVLRIEVGSGETRTVWQGRGRFRFVGAVPGTRSIVARFEGLTVAPDYYRFDDDFRSKVRLTVVEPRLEGVEIGALETFETVVPGHDGSLKTVETNVLLPPGAKAGEPLPTIVFFYAGAPFSRYAQEFGGGAPSSIPVQVFATRGYAVLFADVPMTPEGAAGNPAQEMADAILPQVYRAAALGYTDIRRVAILGHSYGGYGAAAVISQTNLFRAALAVDGVYDLPGSYAEMDEGGASFGFAWAETGQGRMGTHPWADLERYLDNSPYYQAAKMRTPLLLVHGGDDRACPVEEAEKMYNALKRLGREVELAVYEGEDHVPGRWAVANAMDAVERMLVFLDKHLRAP